MTQRQLTLALNKILREESRYTTGLETGGELGLSDVRALPEHGMRPEPRG
ncbi:hypothetical protein [Magnetospirillum moscoviense]|nr:hypothetical protein [Magnetospirillum moscoviense]